MTLVGTCLKELIAARADADASGRVRIRQTLVQKSEVSPASSMDRRAT